MTYDYGSLGPTTPGTTTSGKKCTRLPSYDYSCHLAIFVNLKHLISHFTSLS